MRGKVIVAALLGVFGLGGTTSVAQPEYEFVRLETGDLLATWAWDITNSGMVVGSGVDRAGFERGVLWTDRGMEVLPTPAGYDNVRLTNGNSRGWAIGYVENADTGYSGGIWNGQAWTVIEPWDGFENAWLFSVNEAGVAVGQMDPAWGGSTPIRVQNGVVEELPILPGWQGAYAMRELADGTILGQAWDESRYATIPVRWVDGQPEALPAPYDSSTFTVTAISSTGSIAMYNIMGFEGSWIWDGEQWSQPEGLYELDGQIRDLNANGDFVGHGWENWEPLIGLDGEVYEALDLFDLPSDVRNYYLVALNDQGVAAGPSYTDARPWAFVLNPVPSPATVALLGIGGLFACRRKRAAVVAAVVLAPGLASASQPPRYFVDVIGLHGSGSWYNAIDDGGRVVGMFEELPGVWYDGQVEYLPGPDDAVSCGPLDISDAGILGIVRIDYDHRPIVWVDGEYTTIEVFGDFAWGLAISPVGHIVGSASQLPPDNTSRPFRWFEGEAIDLGSLGRVAGKAIGVNTHGHVVGRSSTRGRVTHAFFWADGGMEDLGMIPDMSHAIANAINDDDTVVGTCYSFGWGLDTPFIWEDGVIAALPTMGEYGTAKAINNDGVIVGTLIPDSIDAYGVVWIDEEVYRLDEHLITDSSWRITEARDLNNPGQILAIASLDGERYDLLLTPACPADFNLDRLVNTRDVVAFLGAWASGDAGADFDGNGTVDSRDVTAFLSAWASGCG